MQNKRQPVAGLLREFSLMLSDVHWFTAACVVEFCHAAKVVG
jgi:hypothetical protein